MKKILFAMLLATSAVQAKPAPESVSDTLDFYYNGRGEGAVMYDFKLCESIIKQGPEKNNCEKEIDPNNVVVGDNALVWMAYLVPKGESVDNILVQSSMNGLTRESHQVKVEGSIRYRTWKPVTFTKAGQWQVTVIEDADQVNLLKQIDVTVK